MISRHKPDWTALLLALMMFMLAATGVPSDELLQDSWKSMLVATFGIAAAVMLLLEKRTSGEGLRFPALLLLPVSLLLYALGSMVWSHTYLGGVEAVRWFLFGLLVWIGANNLTAERVNRLAWGIHGGATIASLWAVLQFAGNFGLFPQGPMPASTFVNRNMFAEYLVCTVPITLLLISSERSRPFCYLIAACLGLEITALLMTGTRSALLALLAIVSISPIVVAQFGTHYRSLQWTKKDALGVVSLALLVLLTLGNLKTTQPTLIKEFGAIGGIERSFSRAQSLAGADEYAKGSFSIRWAMWKTTARMISAHPLAGVGAGAWEVAAPLHQEPGSQIETDYYAHNEFLQLVSEYGLVGWVFALALLGFCVRSAWTTWQHRIGPVGPEMMLRAWLLLSLAALFIVSCAGFPWRMAGTVTLFALLLGALAASDARLLLSQASAKRSVFPSRTTLTGAIVGLAACWVLALYVAWLAAEAENRLVRSVKLAAAIASSANPNDVVWKPEKLELLRLVREGIAINPHYRKITPAVADALARWGDWPNAIWIWGTVLQSRPHIVVMMANIARGHIQMGNYLAAQNFLDRAVNLQPQAPSLMGLQVLIWSKTGNPIKAMAEANRLFDEGRFNLELTQAAYTLGIQHQNPQLAERALLLQTATWPARAVGTWLRLGQLYASPALNRPDQALAAFRRALALAAVHDKPALTLEIPPAYRLLLKPQD